MSNVVTRYRMLHVLIAAVAMLFATAAHTHAENLPSREITKLGNWPQFRGAYASGVADGQHLPDEWDAKSGKNIRWKVKVPGLAHASPIVWGDKLFVTSAISSLADAKIKPGLYGDGDASEDHTDHKFMVYCIDKKTGKTIWERLAYEGVPRSKRHIKATYNNCSPVTDGKHVIAHFGAEGMYAYDMDGKLLWKKDLGDLNVGAYDLPEYEWGPASSPIIYDGLVIVQCDTSEADFVLACDVDTGKTIWKTERNEFPSWGTPTVYPGKRAELILNASNFIMGYDPKTGKELWRLGDSSNITAPTPVFDGDLIAVCSGRRPTSPIFVIRAGASGDITLPKGKDSAGAVVWHLTKRGPYMPTPVIYKNRLYVLQNQGFLSSYVLDTGEKKLRVRVPHGGAGFSASPVAADDRIYLAGEDGVVFVVKAADEFDLISQNDMGEVLMATPALSEGTMYIRGEYHLFAVGG